MNELETYKQIHNRLLTLKMKKTSIINKDVRKFRLRCVNNTETFKFDKFDDLSNNIGLDELREIFIYADDLPEEYLDKIAFHVKCKQEVISDNPRSCYYLKSYNLYDCLIVLWCIKKGKNINTQFRLRMKNYISHSQSNLYNQGSEYWELIDLYINLIGWLVEYGTLKDLK